MILMDRAGSRAALGAAPILGMTDMTRIRTALLATALIAGGTAAQAQQDNGPSFEANVVGGLLSGLGLVDRARPPIDYRERAPLVLPRGNALPPPQDSAAARNPNWPNDPDVARARAAGLAERTPIQRDEFGRTLMALRGTMDRTKAAEVFVRQGVVYVFEGDRFTVETP